MYTGKRDSMIEETLKALCCSNGWCYGILWGFDQRNSLLLILKDAYYEEQMGTLIDKMLPQVHVLGGGVIGQAAFARNHRWMYSDAHHERKNCLGSFETLEDFEDDSDFLCQFSMGIKTVALISVEPWGVVQLGSTLKVLESKDLVDQVKEAFRGMGKGRKLELLENEPSSSYSQFFNPGTQFSSLLSGDVFCPAIENFQHRTDSEGFMETNNSLVFPSQLYASSLDHQNTNLLFTASSALENQIQAGCKSTSHLEQLLSETGGFFDCAANQAHSNNSDCSVLSSSWPPSGLRENVPLSKPISSYESCMSLGMNDRVNLATTSLQAPQFSKDRLNTQSSTMLSDPTDSNAHRQSGLLTLDELFHENAVSEGLWKACPTDDLSHWFSSSPCSSNTSFGTLLSSDQSNATGLIPLSNLSGHKSHLGISKTLPTNSMQSSLTDAFRSNSEDKLQDMSGIDKLLNNLGAEPRCDKPQSWNETLVPVVHGANFDFTNISGCVSEKNIGSRVGTSNSLFSRLGLDQLIDGSASSSCSFAKSRLEDRSLTAAKRRKLDNYSWSHDPDIRNIMELKSETTSREPGLRIGDSSSTGAGNTCSPKRQQEPAKTGKKKSKPGTRPRPKDRQMIQDRLAELRGLIPNGDKMSIDRLLERTIKHLNFMNGLAKHTESLKQVDKTKTGTIQKGYSSIDGGGVTWACEVGDKSMVCPLIVEDLSNPGQMLIEILYEECGFFLEIVDIIRNFGLNILKGVMEVRETKIWAHFIVEAKGDRHGTRHEIFSSLIQLLQMTGQNPAKTSERFGNNISSGTPLFNNCQSALSFPVNLADTIQCANL